MRVTNAMIAKELRVAGSLMKLLMKPTLQTFKTMNWIARRLQGTNIKGVQCSEVYIPGRESGHQIRIRIYQPEHSQSNIPGLLYIHGGGYAMQTPEMKQALFKRLLNTKDCVIVAPDYRRSLAAPYPAALHDCYDTLQWMVAHHDELGFRSDQLFIMGDSAGGGLTAAVTLMARDLGEIKIAFQVPFCPMLDHRMGTESMRDNDAPVWNAEHNRLAWDLYLDGLKAEEITAYASPALNDDFTSLPPALTYIGALDPFLDETLIYFAQLREAGVEVKCKVFEGAYHGFEVVAPQATVSQEAVAYLLDGFAYAVEHYYAEQPEGE